jgi:predicted GIY-YIG superfamily endonuclease
MADYWVYILTNQPRSTLDVGITNDLVRRMHEHREGLVKGFTQRYKLKMLVYFERYDTPHAAIQREKTSSIGREVGNSNWSSRRIRNGAISIAISRADVHHGLPGQARQ